jgi:hypothetical protein
VHFFAQELVITSHTTYPKIGYRGLMDFELWQIQVFHIPIFHVKKYQESGYLSITKVVVFCATNPTKLSLHFSEFSTNFYAFYKF